MITLELGELYGMDDEKELVKAINDLKEMGMSDAEIQEVLDRSKTKSEKGAEDAEEMDKDEKTNSIKMVRSASVSLSKALNAIRPIIMGTNLYFRHKGYESTLRYALDDIEGILEELEGGSKEE